MNIFLAAHCLFPKGAVKTRVLEDILMVFGSSNLNNSFDDKTRPFITKPSEIFIHEDWNASSTAYDADIALLITGDAVPFADSIKPVCMWSNGFGWKADEVFAVGWFKRLIRDKHSVIPRRMQIDIIDSFVCSRNNLGAENIYSNQTFCAITKHQNKSCIGKLFSYFSTTQSLKFNLTHSDNAGAATFIKIDGIFYLHGLISQLGDGHRCNDQKPALITNIMNFTPWINHRSNDSSGKSFAESFENFTNSFPGLLKCFLICIQVHFWFMFCSKRY